MLPEVENLGNFLQIRQSRSVNKYDDERRRRLSLTVFYLTENSMKPIRMGPNMKPCRKPDEQVGIRRQPATANFDKTKNEHQTSVEKVQDIAGHVECENPAATR